MSFISKKHQNKMRIFVLLSSSFLVVIFMILASWAIHLNKNIQNSLKEKQLTPIQEFYALGSQVFVKEQITRDKLVEDIAQYKLYESNKKNLIQGEYQNLDQLRCQNKYGPLFEETPIHCLEVYFNPHFSSDAQKHFLIAWSNPQEIYQIENLTNKEKESVVELPPLLFAQYYGDSPILKRQVELGQFPAICLNAVLAIEDPGFLEHQGFSLRSIIRAAIRNIQAGRKAQGGSTITQQLVKNYFLTHKKSYIRKVKEIIMAVLLEMESSKDEILEAYLNEIYMAQNGVFEVRGFAAASEHYFGKKIEDANPAECSLLAAILNSPGRYNPLTQPENAKARRERVLKKLEDQAILNASEVEKWSEFALPSNKARKILDPAPYFLEAVKAQMQDLNISEDQSLRIITSLNLRAQRAAKSAVQNGVDKLESWYKHLKTKKENGKKLQAALVSVDPLNGYVSALIGGRSFRTAPYNRILKAKRQVGSIMKPFVYLTALENFNPETGETYSPISIIADERFTFSYDDQSWTPKNYDKEYRGNVPMFYALKESLNAATAKLGIDIGLENIIDVSYRLGIRSKLSPLPSLSLGAYELHPYEVLQAYSTLARLGEKTELSFIANIYDSKNDKLYEHQISKEQMIAKEHAAVLLGMLKQTIENGTGAGVRRMGFTHPAAGKTGTTSGYHDAWFAGFTPFHVAVVWLGYDDNSSHGMTGATGAAPIWASYMKEIAMQFPAQDFRWPESVSKVTLDPYYQESLGVPYKEEKPLTEIELIFKKGNEPQRSF